MFRQHDQYLAPCSRCNAHSFVSDPRQVMSWFDEVEERHAFEQLREDLTYDPRNKHWSYQPRAELQELTLPAPDAMDDAHDMRTRPTCWTLANAVSRCPKMPSKTQHPSGAWPPSRMTQTGTGMKSSKTSTSRWTPSTTRCKSYTGSHGKLCGSNISE